MSTECALKHNVRTDVKFASGIPPPSLHAAPHPTWGGVQAGEENTTRPWLTRSSSSSSGGPHHVLHIVHKLSTYIVSVLLPANGLDSWWNRGKRGNIYSSPAGPILPQQQLQEQQQLGVRRQAENQTREGLQQPRRTNNNSLRSPDQHATRSSSRLQPAAAALHSISRQQPAAAAHLSSSRLQPAAAVHLSSSRLQPAAAAQQSRQQLAAAARAQQQQATASSSCPPQQQQATASSSCLPQLEGAASDSIAAQAAADASLAATREQHQQQQLVTPRETRATKKRKAELSPLVTPSTPEGIPQTDGASDISDNTPTEATFSVLKGFSMPSDPTSNGEGQPHPSTLL